MRTQFNIDDQMRRRVFIVESDPIVAQHLVAALLTGEKQQLDAERIGGSEMVECTVVPSQRDFFETDPAMWDIVISASNLHDGNLLKREDCRFGVP